MKETGIIMSGNHPKLILDGIKTQTRRVIKPQPPEYVDAFAWFAPKEGEGYAPSGCWYEDDNGLKFHCKCPYGQVGDRLYCKETWAHDPEGEGGTRTILYKADMDWESEAYFKQDGGKWRSSLFMPRWASRITLEITEVRVERLQEISAEDAIAEGMEAPRTGESEWGEPSENIYEYMRLWDSLNAKRGFGWDKNNWVWVISFKKEDQLNAN